MYKKMSIQQIRNIQLTTERQFCCKGDDIYKKAKTSAFLRVVGKQ